MESTLTPERQAHTAEAVQLLWTGGWDSSFRLLQLLAGTEQYIQPYYIIDTERRSTLTEVAQMSKIRAQAYQRFSNAKERLLPTVIVAVGDIAPDQAITDSYHQLLHKTFLGSQYDWLARFAKEHQLHRLELAVDRRDLDPEELAKEGGLYYYLKDRIARGEDEKTGSYFYMDSGNDEDDLRVFQDFRFPVIDMAKPEMKKEAEEGGYLDLLMNTWFCFRPIFGKPCGFCNPCRLAIEEGMGFRFTRFGMLRFRLSPLILFVKNVLKKILGRA